MTAEGLTGEDVKLFMNLLVKANDVQLSHIVNSAKSEIKRRAGGYE